MDLQQRIDEGYKDIDALPIGSEERSRATNDVVKLAELKLKSDEASRLREESKTNMIFNAVGGAVKFAAGSALLVIMTLVGYGFEESGSVTSQSFKKSFEEAKKAIPKWW